MTWLLAVMALAASPAADSARVTAAPARDSARAVAPAAIDSARAAASAASAAATFAPRVPAPPADTSARVPGSAFRLGWTAERTATLGAFPVASTSPDSITRQGDCRWFGAAATAKLTLREGRLARVVLSMEKPAPHVTSYVLDEMRREGYHRIASNDEGKEKSSEWVGRARASLSISDARLIGDFGPVPKEDAATTHAHPAGVDTLDFTHPSTATDTLPPPMFAFHPPNPERPPAAVQNGVFGRVMMEALVDPTGAVVTARVTRGIPELNDAALAWVQQARYLPYFFHGHSTWFRTAISVPFASQRPGAGAH